MAATYKQFGDRTTSRADIAWTSAADGTATVATKHLNGKISRVTFDSAHSGGTQPTNNYDVTLTDEHGYDLLAAGGANRSNAAATTVIPAASTTVIDGLTVTVTNSSPPVVDGVITVNVTNGGNAKSGTVYVYFDPVC